MSARAKSGPARLQVQKTWKLFIGGEFPRTESGRSMPARGPDGALLANVCRASRKECVKAAVMAARGALPAWAGKSAFLRGQILYRAAEMLETRRAEFAAEIRRGGGESAARAAREVEESVDRLVWYAGAVGQARAVLGSLNRLPGLYFNFSTVEPVGVVGVVVPDERPLLAAVSLLAAALVGGNTAVVVLGEKRMIPGLLLGEVFATSDWPKGTVNLLSGLRRELRLTVARHMDVDGVLAAGVDAEVVKSLEEEGAENVKRVRCLPSARTCRGRTS